MRHLGAFLGAVCLLVVAGPAFADLRKEIEAANAAFVAAYASGDGKTVAALYTPNARVIAPGAETAEGREAIAGFWQGAMDGRLGLLALETREVEAAGETAYELGVARMRSPDGQETSSRYVVVWKRVDGGWKLHFDIWN